MIVHISKALFASQEFLITKITRDIYDDEGNSNYCKFKLQSYFNIPIYLLCEELSSDTVRGEKEFICGYIKYCEARLEFDILEIE